MVMPRALVKLSGSQNKVKRHEYRKEMFNEDRVADRIIRGGQMEWCKCLFFFFFRDEHSTVTLFSAFFKGFFQANF